MSPTTTPRRSASRRSSPKPAASMCLVNNAGYGSYGAVEDVPLEEARRQFEVNLFGAARLIQLVLPGMRERAQRDHHQHHLDGRQDLHPVRRLVPRHQVRPRGRQRLPAARDQAFRHRRRRHRTRRNPNRVERHRRRPPPRNLRPGCLRRPGQQRSPTRSVPKPRPSDPLRPRSSPRPSPRPQPPAVRKPATRSAPAPSHSSSCADGCPTAPTTPSSVGPAASADQALRARGGTAGSTARWPVSSPLLGYAVRVMSLSGGEAVEGAGVADEGHQHGQHGEQPSAGVADLAGSR